MIDLSQYEASLQFLAPALTHYFATGRSPQPAGTGSARYAPHGAYRCRDESGSERWIALAVEDDEQWAGPSSRYLGGPTAAARQSSPSHADRLARPEQRSTVRRRADR